MTNDGYIIFDPLGELLKLAEELEKLQATNGGENDGMQT